MSPGRKPHVDEENEFISYMEQSSYAASEPLKNALFILIHANSYCVFMDQEGSRKPGSGPKDT